jgi:sugar lactone lactonase YvrE
MKIHCRAALFTLLSAALSAQPNPYRTVENFFQLPEGRVWGSSSTVAVDSKGHIWIAERCGANSCVGKTVDPVLEFDDTGKLLKSFGSGLLAFPHGMFIDKQDNIWIADGQSRDAKTVGHVVIKFSPSGKVLMTLGKPGVTGDTPDLFNQPNAVAIAPNGDIFISDGHDRGRGNARVLKYTKDGKFIKQWGGHGSGPGQFEVPHTLAFDSQGRLFVGDRANNRIQIYDQEGNFIAEWKQFGRPSGLFIDSHDVIYVADSESIETGGYAGNNPGFKRGIRIGSAKDGTVTAFIPDNLPGTTATSGAEGVGADGKGTVYGAEVQQKGIKKYVKQ